MANYLDELYTAPAIAAYYAANPLYQPAYFGETKFPRKKKASLDLSWIKGARHIPIALQPSAFDANTIPRKRGTLTKLQMEMPYHKNEYQVDETLRQELIKLGANAPQSLVDTVMAQLFDDAAMLLADAAVVPEIMRMQLLTTGIVSWNDNGVSYSYDYQLDDEYQKVAPTTPWSDTSATPIRDIEDWLTAVTNATGTRPTQMLINTKTLNYLSSIESVKNAIYVFANGTVYPTARTIGAYIGSELGLQVIVYDKGYKLNESDTMTKFVPDGTVVFMPENILGNTWFGTTPAEADLMSEPSVSVSIVDTGVAVAKYKQINPVKTTVEVSEICLPSFEAGAEICIASVL